MAVTKHLSMAELEAGLDNVRQSPTDAGTLEMIATRPAIDAREVLASGQLDVEHGLVGDNWKTRGSSRTEDGSAHPEMQLTLISKRLIALLAQDKSRWPLAGDQLVVDFDLSAENVPPGTRLAVGEAEIEFTAQPHTGCQKFSTRFGSDALKLVNTPEGRELRLRGAYAKVVRSGTIRIGDTVRKV